MAAEPARAGDGSAGAATRRGVSRLLRAGLVLSVLFMAAGFVVKLASGVDEAPGVPLWTLFAGDVPFGDRFMAAGIAVLAATPAFRVLALALLWTRQRDLRFVGVALAVVVTLSAAVLLGHG